MSSSQSEQANRRRSDALKLEGFKVPTTMLLLCLDFRLQYRQHFKVVL